MADVSDIQGLLDKRLLFVTGKGGVGRTTVATALGLVARSRGKRTLVCEVAGQERMSRTFRREGVGHRETELRGGLHAISVDPRRALEEYLGQQLGSGRLTGLLLHNRIFEYFTAAAPGLMELATIGKVWELAQLERRNPKEAPYDIVILDAPASGHGLGMLRTPRTYGEIARVGPIRRRADMIHGFLTDPAQTGFVAVALAQEMPVTETIEFCGRLHDELGIANDLVVVNALMQERFSATEAEALERAAAGNGSLGSEPGAAAAALRAALTEHRRARGERSQLGRLRRSASHVVTLPYVWEPELTLEDLEQLAVELDGRLGG